MNPINGCERCKYTGLYVENHEDSGRSVELFCDCELGTFRRLVESEWDCVGGNELPRWKELHPLFHSSELDAFMKGHPPEDGQAVLQEYAKVLENHQDEQAASTLIVKAFKVIDSHPILSEENGPYTAELLDENVEDGTVVIKGKDGANTIFMPRAVWDELQAQKDDPELPKVSGLKETLERTVDQGLWDREQPQHVSKALATVIAKQWVRVVLTAFPGGELIEHITLPRIHLEEFRKKLVRLDIIAQEAQPIELHSEEDVERFVAILTEKCR